MSAFRVDLSMRYTRISCSPFGAKYPVSKVVQAEDEQDAVRQACLCLDRDLEEILSRVNAINVSELVVEFSRVELTQDKVPLFWNPTWFGADISVPPHFIVR